MKNDLLTLIIICMFILTNLPASTTTGINLKECFTPPEGRINTILNEENPVEFWGVIIGIFPDELYIINYFINLLCNHGWNESHIKIFVDSNLTKQDVIDALEWLDQKEDSNDVSFIFIDFHGIPGKFKTADGYMTYLRLNRAINKLESQGILIFLTPCYSGSAIPYLKKNGRIIITPCSSKETSAGYGNLELYGLEGIADNLGNNNGKISVEELFRYIKMVPLFSDQHPQISDKYPGELELVDVDVDDRRVDQKQVGFDYETFPDAITQEYFMAQSFITNASTLTKVKLVVVSSDDFVYEIKVAIKKDLLGPDLTSAYVNSTHLINQFATLTEFDFPDLNVIPGEKYYIVCSIPDAPAHSWTSLKTLSRDGYADGALLVSEDSGQTWSYHWGHKDLFFIVYDNQDIPPFIEIKSPDNALYLNKRRIISFFKPIIFGDVYFEVEVNDPDDYNICVIFNLDGATKGWDSNPPYTWTLNETTQSRFRHTVEIVVSDDEHKVYITEILIWRFVISRK